MVIEHDFITTLEPHVALKMASDFLQSRGFQNVEGGGFLVGQTEWTSFEMRRGRKKAARAKSVSELPQTIRLEYDRGRITMAGSIEANQVWGGASWGNIGFGISASTTGNPKKMKLHTDLLLSIFSGLEQMLAAGVPADHAGIVWAQAEEAIAQAARKRRRRNFIMVIVLFTILAAFFGFVFYAINNHL